MEKVGDVYYYRAATRAAVAGTVLAIVSILSTIVVANNFGAGLIFISILGWVSSAAVIFFVLLVPVGLYEASMAFSKRNILGKQQKLRLAASVVALLLQVVLILNPIYQLLIL